MDTGQSTVQETSRRCTNRILEGKRAIGCKVKVQRHSHKRRESLLTEECSLAIGNTVESETHNQCLGDKVSGDGYLGWGFTNVEMRTKAFRKIVAEKPFLLMEAHPCANWRLKSNSSSSRMTNCTEPRVHMQSVCRMYKLQHDEGRYFLHEHCQSELPWRKDNVEEIQEMTGAKLMSVSGGNCNLSSSEKPTVTLRNSAKARHLNKSYSEHLERNEQKSVEDLHEDFFLRNTVAAQVEQTAHVPSGQRGREESAGELRRSRKQCSP